MSPGASTLSRMAWPRVSGNDLLIPLGSTEQHGPHLPFSTDSVIAEALGTAVVEALGDLTLAPCLPYGASGEHQAFPGTLSLGTEVTAAVLTELLRSARLSFSGVVLLSAHGGNAEALAKAAKLAAYEGDEVLVTWPKIPGADLHAGDSETSIMLLLHPELVDTTALEAGNTDSAADLHAGLASGALKALSDNGILGDARTATAQRGRDYFDTAVSSVLADVVEWRRQRGSR